MKTLWIRLTTFTVFAVLSYAANAVPVTIPYSVQHNYALQLNNNRVYRVAFAWNLDARANPPLASATNVNNSGILFPPQNITRNANANGAANLASADANCTFIANAPAGGVATGSHRAHGRATLDVPAGGIRASASSVCSTGINTGTVDGRGRIRWQPNWTLDTVQGSSGQYRDPIHFEVLNLDTDTLIEDDLFSISLDLSGPGSASWVDGAVSLNALNGVFKIDMNSSYLTSGTGSLLAEFSNGVLTNSVTSGVFAGLLPSIGSAANFGFSLGDALGFLDMDFDYGAANAKGYDFNVQLGASASASLLPEPGGIALLMLGLALMAPIARRPRIHAAARRSARPSSRCLFFCEEDYSSCRRRLEEASGESGCTPHA